MKLIIFIYALLLGSFYNVVGLRVPIKQSIVRPRSACPSCGRTLSLVELIPVVSYVLQFGKCKQCQSKVSPLYPMMELITASLFVFAYGKLGWTFELMIAWTIISLLVIVFIADITYLLIPDKILLTFAGIFFIERLILPLQPWWDSFLGAAIIFLILLTIAVISKGGLGGGDIKLYAVLGFVLGTKLILLSFLFANLIGSIIALIGVALKIVDRNKPIPFGPFIGIATIIVYFYHQEIITWYLSLL